MFGLEQETFCPCLCINLVSSVCSMMRLIVCKIVALGNNYLLLFVSDNLYESCQLWFEGSNTSHYGFVEKLIAD